MSTLDVAVKEEKQAADDFYMKIENKHAFVTFCSGRCKKLLAQAVSKTLREFD